MLTDQEKRELVLQGLQAGQSLRSICARAGMPAAGTVCGWVNRMPGFARRYRAAQRRAGRAAA